MKPAKVISNAPSTLVTWQTSQSNITGIFRQNPVHSALHHNNRLMATVTGFSEAMEKQYGT